MIGAGVRTEAQGMQGATVALTSGQCGVAQAQWGMMSIADSLPLCTAMCRINGDYIVIVACDTVVRVG